MPSRGRPIARGPRHPLPGRRPAPREPSLRALRRSRSRRGERRARHPASAHGPPGRRSLDRRGRHAPPPGRRWPRLVPGGSRRRAERPPARRRRLQGDRAVTGARPRGPPRPRGQIRPPACPPRAPAARGGLVHARCPERIEGRARPGQLSRQPLRLGLVPGGLADGPLQLAGGDPLRLLGGASFRGRPSLRRTGGIALIDPELRVRRGANGDRPELRHGRLVGFRLASQSLRLGAALEDRLGGAERDTKSCEHGRSVTRHEDPARRDRRLEGEAAGQVRQPARPFEDASGGAAAVAANRSVEGPAAGRGEGIPEAALPGIVGRCGSGRPLGHDHRAALGGERRDGGRRDDVGPRRIGEGCVDRCAERRVDVEVLVDAPPTDPASGTRDRRRFLLGQARLQLVETTADRGRSGAGGHSALVGRPHVRPRRMRRRPGLRHVAGLRVAPPRPPRRASARRTRAQPRASRGAWPWRRPDRLRPRRAARSRPGARRAVSASA